MDRREIWLFIVWLGMLALTALHRLFPSWNLDLLNALPPAYRIPAMIAVIVVFIVGPFVGWLALLKMGPPAERN